jgi:hypothetical protein
MQVWSSAMPEPLDCLFCDGAWLHVDEHVSDDVCVIVRIAERQRALDTVVYRVLGPFVRPTTIAERADRPNIGPWALVDRWDSWSFEAAPVNVGPFFEEVA